MDKQLSRITSTEHYTEHYVVVVVQNLPVTKTDSLGLHRLWALGDD